MKRRFRTFSRICCREKVRLKIEKDKDSEYDRWGNRSSSGRSSGTSIGRIMDSLVEGERRATRERKTIDF